ncbi:hypothetical protein [Enterococcus dispar]|uniref:hypothetical protein n=1 Tax=Enterococcus dispar TaxID=44009 RepID=UPI002891FE99|nr:hypothetical protein [Enterococcus dispar]MDT2704793.1 hypothetical protein [Enterococcus dispar]
MKIELYDVVRLKDGRELTILLIHGDGEAYEVTDQEDVFSIERDDIEKVIWKAKTHSKVD